MNNQESPIRILVADDHPVVRAGVETLVGWSGGHEPGSQATNGREAIQQFRAHHPDITLMDIQMPEMNGLDALIAIRNESSRGANYYADHVFRRRSGTCARSKPEPGVIC